jgi:hypothetical protein
MAADTDRIVHERRSRYVNAPENKKGALTGRLLFIGNSGLTVSSRREEGLCHLTWLYAILPLNIFHLVFEPQLELLEADFLNFLVVRQETLFGELFESLGVLGVFHS